MIPLKSSYVDRTNFFHPLEADRANHLHLPEATASTLPPQIRQLGPQYLPVASRQRSLSLPWGDRRRPREANVQILNNDHIEAEDGREVQQSHQGEQEEFQFVLLEKAEKFLDFPELVERQVVVGARAAPLGRFRLGVSFLFAAGFSGCGWHFLWICLLRKIRRAVFLRLVRVWFTVRAGFDSFLHLSVLPYVQSSIAFSNICLMYHRTFGTSKVVQIVVCVGGFNVL